MLRAAAFLALALVATPALAGPYEDGMRQYAREDYRAAFAFFHRAADAGDAAAMRRIGFLYYDGKGVAQDTALALAWFAKAGEAGDLKAQSDLAFMYETGTTVAVDGAKAAYWARKAAERGDPPSQFRLALLQYLGQGVEQDRVEAAKWWRIAMRTDNPQWVQQVRRNAELGEAKMAPEQVAEAEKRAEAWLGSHPAPAFTEPR
jgi:TPR repeat protein